MNKRKRVDSPINSDLHKNKLLKAIILNINYLPSELIIEISSYNIPKDRMKLFITSSDMYNIYKSNMSIIPKLDLLFIIDTTHSMNMNKSLIYHSIRFLIRKLQIYFNLKVSIVFFKDHNNSDDEIHETYDSDDTHIEILNVVESIGFTHKYDFILDEMEKVPFGGGDDLPEAFADAFNSANRLNFRNNSNTAMLVYSDAYPHGFSDLFNDTYPDGCPCGFDWKNELLLLKKKMNYMYYIDCHHNSNDIHFNFINEMEKLVNIKNYKIKTIRRQKREILAELIKLQRIIKLI